MLGGDNFEVAAVDKTFDHFTTGEQVLNRQFGVLVGHSFDVVRV